MSATQAAGIGNMAWSWSGNGGGVDYLDVVTEFQRAGSSWGTRYITGANGLVTTSREATIYSGGGGGDTPAPSTPGTPIVRGHRVVDHPVLVPLHRQHRCHRVRRLPRARHLRRQLRLRRRGHRHHLHQHRAHRQHHLPLPGTGPRRRRQHQRLLQRRHGSPPAPAAARKHGQLTFTTARPAVGAAVQGGGNGDQHRHHQPRPLGRSPVTFAGGQRITQIWNGRTSQTAGRLRSRARLRRQPRRRRPPRPSVSSAAGPARSNAPTPHRAPP